MTEYIPRLLEAKVAAAHTYYPVILVTGPRQSGKSTMCKHLFPDFKYVNLENITERVNAKADPVGYLDSLGEKVVIDEVQRVPDLLSMIQVRVDDNDLQRYVLTGSSNFLLMDAVSQSLAGRVAQYTLLPFSFPELPTDLKNLGSDELMCRGFYPRVVIRGADPFEYYTNYYNSYVERDLRDVVRVKNLSKFDIFIRLLALRCGSEFNAAALAKEVGVSSSTVTEWRTLLDASYVTFQLTPYYNNASKQLTKMPKVYFTDSGLLCYLLGIDGVRALAQSPLRGQVFENMALAELAKARCNAGREPRINFYRERSGREVDAMVPSDGGVALYEVKSGKTVKADYLSNMQYLADNVWGVVSKQVIYDGPTVVPSAVNIREI